VFIRQEEQTKKSDTDIRVTELFYHVGALKNALGFLLTAGGLLTTFELELP